MNRFALMGTIQITRDGEPVRGFESRKTLALACYLAVRAQPVSRADLANLFWGDKTEAQARANLSRVLYNLTNLFPHTLDANREAIQLKPHAFTLDCAEFELVRGRGDAESLAQAAQLYRGEFMAGVYLDDCPDFEIWLVQARERWQQRIVSVLECLSDYYARRGEFQTALPFAARLLEIEPWREQAHRQMMQLLARTGQRSAALQQYETARRVLAQEFNLAPSAETNALYEKIRAQQIAPQSAPPHNLPVQLSTFFGRETELARIAARLNNPDCRLLTLVGAGGMGKTRLAIETGKNVLHSFSDGVFFVPLAPIGAGQAEFIFAAIARALRIPFKREREPITRLLQFLRGRQILFLLDNFEHLLGGDEHADGAARVLELLQNAPDVKILVTSRHVLNAQAEWVTRVEGLSYPTTAPRDEAELVSYNAARMFVERARQVDEQLVLDASAIAAITRICARVEGMPLALELAAARLPMMSLEQIAARLEETFRLLASENTTAPRRHRTLQALFDWSYDLLSEPERELFRRLSILANGWDLKAVENPGSACGLDNAFELLQLLIQKSLVLVDVTARPPRYRMLEPIRQYALEKLAACGNESETRIPDVQAPRQNLPRNASVKHIRNRDSARWLE